jgi:hypothetical protein
MVGIIYKMKFVSSKNNKFGTYIDYMDRDEAARTNKYKDYTFAFDDLKKTDLATYTEYMGRPQATSGLFSIGSDELNHDEIKTLKNQFLIAQQNGSLMWQDVISFDNEFLSKYQLYDKENDQLDDKKIKQAVRIAVSDMLEREGMSNSAIWSGAIHYNTDHFHVHVAIVEPEPTRERANFHRADGSTYEDYRGNRKATAGGQSSYERFKSLMLENIIDNSKTTKMISELQRNVISSKNKNFINTFDFKARKEFKYIFESLPSDKRLWRYNNNAMAEYRPMIDQFINRYIEKHYSKEYQEYNRLLDSQVEYFRDVYGKSRAEDYRFNKLYGKDGLHTNLGNQLLKEMNVYDKHLKEKYGITGHGKVDLGNIPANSSNNKYFKNHKMENNLKRLFDKTWEEKKREFEHEKFKRELEAEKEEEKEL